MKKRPFQHGLYITAFLFCRLTLMAQTRIIPHLTRPGSFNTTILVENLAVAPLEYSLTPYDEAGNPLTPIRTAINGMSVQTFSPAELFNGQVGVSHFEIEGEDVRVTVAYTAALGGSPAHVGENTTRAARYRIFPGDWSRVFDGCAVVNTGTEVTDVWVTQWDFDNQALKTVKAIEGLAPMAKGLYIIGSPSGSEFENQSSSWFEVHAHQKLAITALRGNIPNSDLLWVNQVALSNPPINKVNNDAPGATGCIDPLSAAGNIADANNMPQAEVWIAVSEDGRIASAAKDYRFSPTDDTTYNLRVWDGLYLSDDGGGSWKNVMFTDSNPNSGLEGVIDGSYGQEAGASVFIGHQSDPVVAFDRDGNLYTTALGFQSDHDLGNFGDDPSTVLVSRRDQNGELAPGTTHFIALEDNPGLFNDKCWIAVDRTSPVESTVVAVTWRLFTLGANPLAPAGGYLAVSGDGAASFSQPIALPILPQDNINSQFYQPLIGPDPGNGHKTLYIFFRVSNDQDFTMRLHLLTADLEGLEPGTQALYDHLSNGSNWTNLANLLPQLFYYSSGGFDGAFRFNSFFMPAIDRETGHLYAVVQAFETQSQGSQVLVTKSTDGGLVWTAPQPIDYAEPSHQIMPAAAFNGGKLSVIWYDSRHQEESFVPFSTIKDIDVYYAELSPDLSLQRLLRLTPQTQRTDNPVFTRLRPSNKREDHRLHPHDMDFNSPLSLRGIYIPKQRDPSLKECEPYGFIGDYIGIAADQDFSYAVWCDLRDIDHGDTVCAGHSCNGRRNQNIYFARIRKAMP